MELEFLLTRWYNFQLLRYQIHNMYELFLTEVRTIIKSKYEEIDNKVTILLGQRLDYRKRGLFSSKNYDVRYSFSGRFSDLRIWRGEISDEKIQSLSSLHLPKLNMMNSICTLKFNVKNIKSILRKCKLKFCSEKCKQARRSKMNVVKVQ